MVENDLKGGNVYAELGSTWRYLMRDPDSAAHALGKMLKYIGEDNILWGNRFHLVWLAAGSDPGLPRFPDQRRVAANPWLPRAHTPDQAQNPRPQRAQALSPRRRRPGTSLGLRRGPDRPRRLPANRRPALPDLRPEDAPGIHQPDEVDGAAGPPDYKPLSGRSGRPL